MTIDFKDVLQILSILIGLIIALYLSRHEKKIEELEKKIDDKISDTNNKLERNIKDLEGKMDVQFRKYEDLCNKRRGECIPNICQEIQEIRKQFIEEVKEIKEDLRSEIKALWNDGIHSHSHSGLAVDSVVTRKPSSK